MNMDQFLAIYRLPLLRTLLISRCGGSDVWVQGHLSCQLKCNEKILPFGNEHLRAFIIVLNGLLLDTRQGSDTVCIVGL